MGSSIVSNSGPLDLTMPTYGPTITSTLEHTMPAISESVMGERLLSVWLRTFMTAMVMMMMIMVMMVVVMMVMVSRERAWNFGFLSEERFPNNTVAQEVIKSCIDYFQNSEHSTLTKSPK